MSEARNMIAGVLRSATHSRPDDLDIDFWQADAILTAIPDIVGSLVKPLDWRPLYHGGSIASTSFGDYKIELDRDNDFIFSVAGTTYWFWPNELEAKAAAQKNYERRILSALSHTGETQ